MVNFSVQTVKKGVKKLFRTLVPQPKMNYDNKKHSGNEEVDMTQLVQKIYNINLPPHQLRELGLTEGWQKKVSKQYIEKVIQTAERFKTDLKELSKR